MWAFAMYDQKKEQVILLRDPFGIKPLHYGYDDDVCTLLQNKVFEMYK